MAFNRKPKKQILLQHRFEEFNQNSISKLISLRSTTHWHVLTESEQLQRESWNNTLSGPLAAGPHRVGAQGPLACHFLTLDRFRSIEETSRSLTHSILQVSVVTAATRGFSEGWGGQRTSTARGSFRSTAGLFQSPKGVPTQTLRVRIKLKTCRCSQKHAEDKRGAV